MLNLIAIPASVSCDCTTYSCGRHNEREDGPDQRAVRAGEERKKEPRTKRPRDQGQRGKIVRNGRSWCTLAGSGSRISRFDRHRRSGARLADLPRVYTPSCILGVMVHGVHGAHGNAPCCWAAVECWCCVLLHAAKTARTQRRRASRVSNARHGSGVQRSKGKRCGRSRASSGRSRTKERENPARKEDGGCKATEGDGGREAGRLQAGCVRARVCSRRRSLCEAYRVLRCAGAPVALLLLSSLR